VALGMSMEYGLRTSLLNMRWVFQDLVDNKKIESIPVYLRLLYFDDKNRRLIDVGSTSGQIDTWIEIDKSDDTGIHFRLVQGPDGPRVILQSPGYFNGQKKGLIIAVINQNQVFEHLIHQLADESQISFRLEAGEQSGVESSQDLMSVDYQLSEVWIEKTHGLHTDVIAKIEVPGTPFFLIATHHGLTTGDYLISNTYLMSLGLLSILVFLSVAIGIRSRVANLALYGEFLESQRQGKKLEEFIAARTIDLTHAKNEAEQAQQMLQIVLDTIPVRVFWKDTDLHYLGCNKLFAKDAGLDKPEDLIGKSDFDMGWVEQAEFYQKDDRAVIESQHPKLDYEEPQTTPDGKTIWLLTSKIPLHDKQGKTLGMLGTYIEITERKRAEEQMEVARIAAERANRAKSEFLANMSHELRTPMHAILSFSEIGISRATGEHHAKLLQYFSRINESGKRLLSLLDELLDLSKLEAGRMQFNFTHQDLAKVIDTEVAEFQELLNKKSLNLEIDRPAFETICRFDHSKMLQVVRNLLSNAIKFTSEGKQIHINFDMTELPAGKRRTDKTTVPAISFCLADEGIGIPEDELMAVFDKFVQSSKTRTGAGGTGLGLAICKEIIESHGGRIEAANRRQGGAVFTVTLPIDQAPNRQPLAPDYPYPDIQVEKS
jgi:PAS domain S-box-containing protein